MEQRVKRVLCLSTTGIGNTVLYIPVIRSLALSWPEAGIDVLVSNAAAREVLVGLPGVRTITVFEKKKAGILQYYKLARELRKENYDIVITSFLDKSFRIAVFCYFLGIRVRVGFKNDWWKIFYTHKVPIIEEKHEVEYNLDLVRSLGLETIDTSIDIEVSEKDKSFADEFIKKESIHKAIGFHIGSGTDLGKASKRWALENFVSVADHLAEKYKVSIILFGGEEEYELNKKMAQLMKTKPILVVGKTDIKQAVALIKKCTVFISNDSGLMHIAAAAKVPIVAIFGPTLYWKNYPWHVYYKLVRKDMDCSPCYRFKTIECLKDGKCLSEIKAKHVIQKAEEILSLTESNRELPYNICASVPARIKRVSIITPDFSHNCVGRAYLIAELLRSSYNVEIIGPAFAGTVWHPIKNIPDNVEYKYVSTNKDKFFVKDAYTLLSFIKGEVVIISKAVLPSMFIGLLLRLQRKLPVVIDIDDWELGFEIDRLKWNKGINKVRSLLSIFKLIVCELAAQRITNKIVSNTYLQNKFGGTIVPHVRDTDYFDPKKYSRDLLRKQYTIPEGAQVILFMGTPREHKGLAELVFAFNKIKKDTTYLMIAGFDLDDSVQAKVHDTIKANLGEQALLYGLQPFAKVPEFLAMSDIVVIPQTKTRSSVGQIPAKLFDAMAMAKTIIASRVNDIPKILEGRGCLYEPGNVDELAYNIHEMLTNKNLAKEYGEKARKYSVENYSYHVMKSVIDGVLQQAVKRVS